MQKFLVAKRKYILTKKFLNQFTIQKKWPIKISEENNMYHYNMKIKSFWQADSSLEKSYQFQGQLNSPITFWNLFKATVWLAES